MDTPDVRLTLPRPDGEVRVQLAVVDGRTVVQIVRAFAERVVGVTIAPEELDALVGALQLCRRLTLGVPDPRADVQRLVEASAARRRRKR